MRGFLISCLAIALATPAMADETMPGRAVFSKWCAPCHAPGPMHPGTQALEELYSGEVPAALEERMDLEKDSVAYFVRHGTSIMPFFRKSEVSEKDLAALTDYLTRNNPE